MYMSFLTMSFLKLIAISFVGYVGYQAVDKLFLRL